MMSPEQLAAPTLPLRWLGRVRVAAADIKLSHSVFALPFAVLGAFLARVDSAWSTFGGQIVLVVLCMIAARTWAMLVNRLADARLDADNPRTARRAVASGRLSAGSALGLALSAAGAFLILTACFAVMYQNNWPLLLALPVLGWLAFYSFAKRFTWLCHVLLGSALAIAPVAAALAVRPEAVGDTPALWWIAAMVLLWVAGFDVIYALQDTEFDQRMGLFSIPSRLGVPAALWLSRAMHVGSLACLALAWRADARFGGVFLAAVVLAGVLLVAEHVVLAKRGKAGLDMAFFTLNGVISCAVGTLGVVDLVG